MIKQSLAISQFVANVLRVGSGFVPVVRAPRHGTPGVSPRTDPHCRHFGLALPAGLHDLHG